MKCTAGKMIHFQRTLDVPGSVALRVGSWVLAPAEFEVGAKIEPLVRRVWAHGPTALGVTQGGRRHTVDGCEYRGLRVACAAVVFAVLGVQVTWSGSELRELDGVVQSARELKQLEERTSVTRVPRYQRW